MIMRMKCKLYLSFEIKMFFFRIERLIQIPMSVLSGALGADILSMRVGSLFGFIPFSWHKQCKEK